MTRVTGPFGPRLDRAGLPDPARGVGGAATTRTVGGVAPPSSSASAATFDGVRAGSRSSGLSRATGRGGTEDSAAGFDLLARIRTAATQSKKGAIAAAVGIALLLPPTVGQMVNPGMPAASSPIAMQMQEKAQLPSGQQIRSEVRVAQQRVPSGLGEAREDGVRAVMGRYESARKIEARALSVQSVAHRQMEALRDSVDLDARMGKVVDVYWFGVPVEHAAFHAGRSDARQMDSDVAAIREAVVHARATAREEVSRLLVDESPAYAQLHADYTLERERLQAATHVRTLADDAADALSSAEHAITMRNVTPMMTTETYTDAQGKTQTRVVPNPTWHMWNSIAIAEKGRAEARVRELNQAVAEASALLGVRADEIDSSLINALDFFGQPSFLIWSFDRSDVQSTERAAAGVRDEMDRIIAHVRPIHDRLEREVNAQIDARWMKLEQDAQQGPQDPAPGPRAPRVVRQGPGGVRRPDDAEG